MSGFGKLIVVRLKLDFLKQGEIASSEDGEI